MLDALDHKPHHLLEGEQVVRLVVERRDDPG